MLEKHLEQGLQKLKPQLLRILSRPHIKKLLEQARMLEIREEENKVILLVDSLPIAEIIIGEEDFFLVKKII